METGTYLWLHNYEYIMLPGHILKQWELPTGEILVWMVTDKEDYEQA